MEHALKQGLKVCPFLGRYAVHELRTQPSLIQSASRCPIMNHALSIHTTVRKFFFKNKKDRERKEPNQSMINN